MIAGYFDNDGPFVRPGTCKHPSFTDEAINMREAAVRHWWSDADPLKCPDCREYLYPHDDGDDIIVYAGEPYGADKD